MLTELEKKMLIMLIHDDFIGDRGWEDEMAATWCRDAGEFAKDFGLEQRQVPALIGSLVKKDLLYSDGESIMFTDAGRDVIREQKLHEVPVETLV
jgi:hypothetical protein